MTTTFPWKDRLCEAPLRDNQRARVYKAEREAFADAWRVPLGDQSMKTVTRFVLRVEHSAKWRKLFALWGHRPLRGRNLDVYDGRGCRVARGGRYQLTLPRWARTVPVILHEMAHAASPPSVQHGWPFCAIYLELVGAFVGTEAKRKLRAAFKANRVRYTPKRSQVRVVYRAAACKP